MLFFSIIFSLIAFTFPNLLTSAEVPSWLARSQTPIITSPLSSSQRSLQAIKIDRSGKIYPIQILKQQLSNELRLPLRDLRVVDPSLPKQIQATFISRPQAILLCIENIKVIIQHDSALIFNPYQPEVEEMILALQQLLSQVTSSSDTGDSVIKGRFEHVVLEAALNVVCTNLMRLVRELSPAAASTLNGIRAESRGLDVVQTQSELLPQKNKLDELRKRVKEVRRAIADILNNDEDMMMMHLSPIPLAERYRYPGYMNAAHHDHRDEQHLVRHSSTTRSSQDDMFMNADEIIKHDPHDHDDHTSMNRQSPSSKHIPRTWRGSMNSDIKSSSSFSSSTSSTSSYTPFKSSKDSMDTMGLDMLFEHYLNEIEWIASEIEELVDEVTNTEEYVVLQLDLLRNRTLRFELLLSVSTFVVTCGALVTGVFGMNLLNHFEMHGTMFYVVLGLIFAAMGAAFSKITRYGRKEKLF